ncbi:MAG: hypothetical protein QW543_04390 [Sulfolobales archaeon]
MTDLLKISKTSSEKMLLLSLVAIVALSVLSLVLYLQLEDAISSLSDCRKVLLSTRSDIELLGRYAQNLYMNYTNLYHFTRSLVENYTVLQKAYQNINQKYEDALRMLKESQKQYEELYASYELLRANYSSLLKQLEILYEVLEVIKELRLYYLASRVVGFEYINASSVIVLTNSSYTVRPIRVWTRTLFSSTRPTTITIPTPKPGYLIIHYNNSYGVCLSIAVTNTYVVPGHYITRNTYFSFRTCLTQGEVVVPVLPHSTVLEVLIPPILVDGLTFRLADVLMQFQYFTVEVSSESLPT